MAAREIAGGSLPVSEKCCSEKMTESELTRDIAEFRPMLFRLAYSYTGSLADCDDIMQEAFIKLYYRGRGFDSPEAKKAWLIRVTINLCKNHAGAWWRSKRDEFPDNFADGFPENTGEPSDDFAELSAALRKLRPAYRAVIHLHYYEGFSASEISSLLGISVSAVTTRLQRGREMLRNMLKD